MPHNHSEHRSHREDDAIEALPGRLDRLEANVSVLAQAIRLIATALEGDPTRVPPGAEEIAAAGRQAHEALLVAEL